VKHRRRWPWIVLAVGIALLAVRLMLPGWVTAYLNGKLDRMGSYHGRIADVDLQLWRGAYTIRKLVIVKQDGAVPVPLLDAPRIELAVSWRELLHGGIVAEVEFWQPQLNIVDGKSERDTQTGRGVDWREHLESLLAIRLNEVDVHDGTFHFRNFNSDPEVDLVATHVDAQVYNLTNTRKRGASRAAIFDIRADVLGEAPLESHAEFDPFGHFEDFRIEMRVTKIDLTHLNDFLQAYAKVDAESGTGEFVMQLEASDSQLSGYAKPLFRHVTIFDWKHDLEQQHDNPLRALWEALAGGVENVLKNQRENQFATRVEFSGRTDQPQMSALQAILGILRNGFIKAYKAQFEEIAKPAQAEDRDSHGEP